MVPRPSPDSPPDPSPRSRDVPVRDSERPTAPGTRSRLRHTDVLVLVALAVLLAVTAARHELGHDEAQAWNIARAADSPFDVVELSRHEGHTPPWYLVLWTVSRTGDVEAMKAVAVVLTLLVAASLLRDRPFGAWATALASGGYYLVYEYSIITRPYVLALALAALFATLYFHRRVRDPVLPGLLCGLIASTSSYGLLLSGALFVVVAGHSGVLEAGAVPTDEAAGRRARRRLLLGVVSWLVPLGVSAWLILTPFASNEFESALVAGGQIGKFDLGDIVAPPVLPQIDRVPGGIGAWFSGPLGGAARTVAAIIGLLAVAVRLRRSAVLLVAWGTAVVAIASGGLYSGFLAERHMGHLWIAALVLCWIGASDTRLGKSLATRVSSAILFVLLCWHVVIGLAVAGYDIVRPVAPWSDIVEAIERLGGGPPVLLADFSYEVGAVIAELDRPAYSLKCDCFTRHYDWSWSTAGAGIEGLAETWCALAADGDQVVVMSDDTFPPDARLELVADEAPTARGSDGTPMRVWRLSEAERRRCRAG